MRYRVAVLGGAAVGASAATLYKWVTAPLLTGFMSDDATTAQIETRRQQATTLDRLLREAAPAIEAAQRRASVTCSALDFECRKLRAAAVTEHQHLRHSLREAAAAVASVGAATAEDRDAYVAQFGCVAWTASALDAIARSSGARGIVEIGAGTGHWAAALRQHDSAVDVVAYDNASAIPEARGVRPSPLASAKGGDSFGDARGSKRAGSSGGVILGVDGTHAATRHPERALLLVAPPPGAAAAQWLTAYRGDLLLYVGEGRGGAHADQAFFDIVERGWRLVETVPVSPFPGGCERLWVLQRGVGREVR